MDGLTLYGLVAVTLMLVFYALEDRHASFVLAFAAACAMGSVYGFLQGAWPFGLIEAVWTVIALRRWRVKIGRGEIADRRQIGPNCVGGDAPHRHIPPGSTSNCLTE